MFAALANTDDRVRRGRPVTPSFLFAALLWHQVLVKARAYEAKGEHAYPALNLAMNDVLDQQCDSLAIPRRYTADMREIWNMQPRFELGTWWAEFAAGDADVRHSLVDSLAPARKEGGPAKKRRRRKPSGGSGGDSSSGGAGPAPADAATH